MTLLVAAGARSRTGHLLAAMAERRGVRVLTAVGEDAAMTAMGDARAVIVIPEPGDAEIHAHIATRSLIAVARRHAPHVHLLLVSSFAVGHGSAHPVNRVTGSLPGRLAAERALRTSGLHYTIVRPTWLTDDPPGAHAVSVSQDPHVDGMLARADLAGVLLAAVDNPTARAKTFAVFNEPGEPDNEWAPAFARLAADPDTVPA